MVKPQTYNIQWKFLKPALSIVLVRLGYHTFEMPDVIPSKG